MAQLPTVLVSKTGHVVTLTLNAPARRNAISFAMRTELAAVLRTCQDDPLCRCIVLTGADGTFCSGGDIGEMEPPEGMTAADYARHRIRLLQDVIRLIAQGSRPVVAMVAGSAAGAGLSLAAASSYVIAERDARFSASFTRLGLFADCGLTWSLPRRTSPARAIELLATGRTFAAEEASRIGLVDALAEPGAGLESALTYAKAYGATAPLAVMRTRQTMIEQPPTLDAAFDLELREQAVLRVTEDHQEARRAFAEKRPPSFIGA